MLKVLDPIAITDAKLVSSSLPEADSPEWVSGRAYVEGEMVMLRSAHGLYRCVVAITGTVPPDKDSANWVRIAPTNRWAMFDASVSTKTLAGSSSMTVVIRPGRCNGIALINLGGAASATITCTYGIGVDASKSTEVKVEEYAYNILLTRTANYAAGTMTLQYSINLQNRSVSNWSDYFVEPYTILSDVFVGFSSRADMQITLSMPAGSEIGALMVGNYIELGDTGYGVTSGIEDYSVKQTDEFGVTTLVERDFAKRVNFPITVENFAMRRSFSTLASLRARPALFVGSEDYRYSPFTVFGYVSNFEVALSFATYSIINLEVKGLT